MQENVKLMLPNGCYIYITFFHYMVFFPFVLIKPVPGILRASSLIRYRFVFGCAFRKCI